jgi:hypothetical protein
MSKLRSIDYFAVAVASLVAAALALLPAEGRPWWQTYPGVVFLTAVGGWDFWQGLRARKAERAFSAAK